MSKEKSGQERKKCNRIKISGTELRHLYIEEGLSCNEIAERFQATSSAIPHILRRYGIPIRGYKESVVLALRRGRGRAKKLAYSDLFRLYIQEELNLKDVAKELGVSHNTVAYYMKQHGIRLRTRSEYLSLTFQREPRTKRQSYRDRGGYIWLYNPNHPSATAKGYVLEHRLVMEEKLGRYLMTFEHVHHIDGVKHHNTDGNLELLSPANHRLREQFCRHCPLKKEIRLLRWQIKVLSDTLQCKMEEL